jgi:hypothetical protein
MAWVGSRPRAPARNVAEGIDASGLSWQVEKEAIAIDRGESSSTDWQTPRCEQIAGFYATVRQDTREVLGIVGEPYRIVQNDEAFAFIDQLSNSNPPSSRREQCAGMRSYGAGTIKPMNEPQAPEDGVKHLTVENWLQPDPICLKFGELNIATGEQRSPTGERWAAQILSIDLAATVPSGVRDMWEAARGLLLYGWFYYAIYAIGEHELRRVADAAVLHRYQQADGPPTKKPGPEGEKRWPDLMRRVGWLIDAGVIPAEKRERWDGICDLRNETTHISIRHLTTPHEALRVLELLAGEIDALFVP